MTKEQTKDSIKRKKISRERYDYLYWSGYSAKELNKKYKLN